MDLLSFIRERLAMLAKERQTSRELARLSDRDLADIGLERDEIPFVARAATRMHALESASAERVDFEPAGVLERRALNLPAALAAYPA